MNWTLRTGDERGEPGMEEKESFLFLPLVGVLHSLSCIEGNFSPKRGGYGWGPFWFNADLVISCSARRDVLTRVVSLCVARGVKNLLNLLGVIGGGLFGLPQLERSDSFVGESVSCAARAPGPELPLAFVGVILDPRKQEG